MGMGLIFNTVSLFNMQQCLQEDGGAQNQSYIGPRLVVG